MDHTYAHMWIDLRRLKSQWSEYHTQGLVHRNRMQEKTKGNRPATSNGRENIHGNLPKCEWLTNNLWTIYEQTMNKSLLDRSFNFNSRLSPNSFCPPALRYLCLFPLSQAVFLLSSFRCFPLRSAKPRLCWIMNNAWAVHEQFMNKVGLAFLANTWPESFGKWYLIVCARTCLRDWKKHSQRLLKKIHEQVALDSLRRNRLRDCLKT